jgi:hypothetical protein
MNQKLYIMICLLLWTTISMSGCYEPIDKRAASNGRNNTGLVLAESKPDLIQTRLDSLIGFMIQHEIVEIKFKMNNLRFVVEMQRMKDEKEINNAIYTKILEDIEHRNATFYTSYQQMSSEIDTSIAVSVNGIINDMDDLVILIKARVDTDDDLNK